MNRSADSRYFFAEGSRGTAFQRRFRKRALRASYPFQGGATGSIFPTPFYENESEAAGFRFQIK